MEQNGVGVELLVEHRVQLLSVNVADFTHVTVLAVGKLNRAHKVVELGQIESEQNAEENREYGATYEPFPGLLGRQLDEGRPAEVKAAQVRHAVVNDDHRHGENEPDQPVIDVLNHEVTLRDNDKERHMCPRKQGELTHVALGLEGEHERDEP